MTCTTMPDDWVPLNGEQANASAPWHPETGVGEVVQYYCDHAGTLVLCFAASARRKNAAEMAVHLRALRRIVTRMEQFRRMKERQWSGVVPINSKREENNE